MHTAKEWIKFLKNDSWKKLGLFKSTSFWSASWNFCILQQLLYTSAFHSILCLGPISLYLLSSSCLIAGLVGSVRHLSWRSGVLYFALRAVRFSTTEVISAGKLNVQESSVLCSHEIHQVKPTDLQFLRKIHCSSINNKTSTETPELAVITSDFLLYL